MKFSKEQLLKLVEPTTVNFKVDEYLGQEDDVFKRIFDINVDATLDYFEEQCDVDLTCNYKAEMYDVNTHKLHIEEYSFTTYFVVTDKYYEDEYFVYEFDKNTLNLDSIVKEEIYYRLPLDYTLVDSEFIDEDEFYYNEYQKIKDNKEETQASIELSKLQDLFD